MRQMIYEIRIELACLLMFWSLKIAPDTAGKRNIEKFIEDFSKDTP